MISFDARADALGIIWLSGELDMATADELRRTALAALDGQQSFVIDLSELTFLDSSGIRELLALASRSPSGMVLRRPSDGVRRVLEIAGVSVTNTVRVEP
jgi:anti-anti-sigma factor